MTYAGIGNRHTPPDILREMLHVGEHAAQQGHVLRTGSATGADQAFMAGCIAGHGHGEIFLPWASYERQAWRGYKDFEVYLKPSAEAEVIAGHFHPVWSALTKTVKALHARNTHIIMGADCDRPVDFIVCYTPGGMQTGGTGQALRLAKANCIQVFDLGSPEPWATILNKVYNAFGQRQDAA